MSIIDQPGVADALQTPLSSSPLPALSLPALTLVMPTISWEEPFGSCLGAALDALGPEDEALVVFDGEPPPAPEWLLHSPAALLHTGQRSGPAAARNLAAQQARGEILLFVDADVELHADAVARLRDHFAADPDLAAVFGSYDDRPAASGVVSRFRNLLHHHTHHSHPGPASSFWAGCGAVRRQTFLALGGFDAEAYERPCIEDIEFGLRLSDAGGRILLDPSIQGTHHKRWTLASMISTDVRQRAIPWSQLLLRSHELPGTLNLDQAARLSAGACLLLPVALMASWMPALRALSLAITGGCLALLLVLNRDFYGLLLRRCGPLEAAIGIALHALYLTYSSFTFVLIHVVDVLQRPLRWPGWLKSRPVLWRRLVISGLILLGLLGLATLLRGLIMAWLVGANDLGERFREWQLFQQGIYPAARLATPWQRALPGFRTSVYLPWALPMFGLLFSWAGQQSALVFIQALSLLSLLGISAICWRSLRPWGLRPAWLGALAPLAINGNSTCLQQGQFSILCMGLISLQWLLLLRQRPMPAGVCWALAMVKPQIGWSFALPFLCRAQKKGLLFGLGLLCLFTAFALFHTQVGLLRYLGSWARILPYFMGSASLNAAAGLFSLLQQLSALWLWLFTAIGIMSMILLAWAVGRWHSFSFMPKNWLSRTDPLLLAGLCAVLAQLSFYHRHYDNIILFPALLAALRLPFQRPRVLELGLAVMMALSLWTPQRLMDALPGSAPAQTLIWLLVGADLLRELLVQPSPPKLPIAARNPSG